MYEKMKGILLPRNYFKFPFVKVIVSKIACKSLYNTKNHFLTDYLQKVVRENFFKGFGDVLSIKNMFKPIRIINRSHSQLIWTRAGENETIEKRWITYPPQIPLKKRRTIIVDFLLPAQSFTLKIRLKKHSKS